MGLGFTLRMGLRDRGKGFIHLEQKVLGSVAGSLGPCNSIICKNGSYGPGKCKAEGFRTISKLI